MFGSLFALAISTGLWMIVAIEVDSRTHGQPKWMFLDQRKIEVLRPLVWKVVRFRIEEVLANPGAVVLEIEKLRKSKE